jgi:DNA-binding CsgD family transcriptional regulator
VQLQWSGASGNDVTREWREVAHRVIAARANLARDARDGAALTERGTWRSAETRKLAEWSRLAALTVQEAMDVFEAVGDLIRRSKCRAPAPAERWIAVAISGVDAVFESAMQLREQLFAAELGERLGDEDGEAVDAALIDWRIDPTSDHRWALEHVMTRRPRLGPIARWRQVMRDSSQEGFYRWVHKSVRGAARDQHRPGRRRPAGLRQRGAAPEIELLALIDRAGLSNRETEITLAVARGESIADAARRMGIAGSTARVLFYRAKLKFRRAHL